MRKMVRSFYLSFCVLAGASSLAGQAPQPEALDTLPGNRPVPVRLGAYLIDLEGVDQIKQTFTLVGYFTAEWTDSRLAGIASNARDGARVNLEQIWWPKFELVNAYSPRSAANIDVRVDSTGKVRYLERFAATLSSELNLRLFPFDEHILPLEIESFTYDTREMIFKPRSEDLRSPRAFLAEWDIAGVSEKVDSDKLNPWGKEFSRYVLEIQVRRKSGFYVWAVFLPLFLITVLSWSIFWITSEDIRARTSISVTALLSAIAFNLLASGNLPRASYVTFMNTMVLNCYFLIFLATIIAVLVHHRGLQESKVHSAGRISRNCRWAFPLLFLVSNALVVLFFFGD